MAALAPNYRATLFAGPLDSPAASSMPGVSFFGSNSGITFINGAPSTPAATNLFGNNSSVTMFGGNISAPETAATAISYLDQVKGMTKEGLDGFFRQHPNLTSAEKGELEQARKSPITAADADNDDEEPADNDNSELLLAEGVDDDLTDDDDVIWRGRLPRPPRPKDDGRDREEKDEAKDKDEREAKEERGRDPAKDEARGAKKPAHADAEAHAKRPVTDEIAPAGRIAARSALEADTGLMRIASYSRYFGPVGKIGAIAFTADAAFQVWMSGGDLKEIGRMAADMAVPGITDGFAGITGKNIGFVDRVLNIADTVTGIGFAGGLVVAAGGVVAAPFTGGASLAAVPFALAEAGIAGLANLGVQGLKEVAWDTGLSTTTGPITQIVRDAQFAVSAVETFESFREELGLGFAALPSNAKMSAAASAVKAVNPSTSPQAPAPGSVQNKSDVISSVTPANKAGRGAARGILAPSLPVVSDAPGIAPDQPKPPGRKITGLDEYTLAD